MKTVLLHSEIDAQGRLRLEIPLGLPAGGAEVLVVVQPENGTGNGNVSSGGRLARSGLFGAATAQNVDVDGAIGEMNGAWKAKLMDLT